MIKKIVISILLFILLLSPSRNAAAQEAQTYPVYVVQAGDTISLIASKFGVSAVDLISVNKISNPNSISAGIELIIPGLKGISGKLVTKTVPIGESLNTLSLRYQVPKNDLIRLNRITSPLEIFAGANLILPQQDLKNQPKGLGGIENQESLFEIAVKNNTNPWVLQKSNHLVKNWEALPGELLFSNIPTTTEEVNGISPIIKDITIKPLPLIQGKTTVITIHTIRPLDLSGLLSKYKLHFFKTVENEYVALQGISAVQDIGLSELILKGEEKGQDIFDLDQALLTAAGNYGEDPPLEVDPTTIDPKITQPEDDQINKITSQVTATRLWKEAFQFPTDEPCIKSWFGNRRLYNNSLRSFHTGLDLGVCANNLNVYAPAPGVVVFTGLLTIRGNTTIIDHGWGIYSLYFHQNEIMVKVGDQVTPRQIIGIIGATGRVTGPHLHWEIRVNNIQINPIDWVDKKIP